MLYICNYKTNKKHERIEHYYSKHYYSLAKHAEVSLV